MEQAIIRTGRRTGWSENENKLLWETADEAQQQGLPLKAVFEQIARQTGRRPNSIRNYYYAQVRRQEGGAERAQRFVPFTQDEVDWLMEQVLRARAQGQSVRACLQQLSDGDHSRMLRYQNKYRSVIKNRPDYVRQLVERLNQEGVDCDQPHVNHRVRADLGAACDQAVASARRTGDAELVRALEVIARHLCHPAGNPDADSPQISAPETVFCAAQALIGSIKDFVARSPEQRTEEIDVFCEEISRQIGAFEACLPVESDVVLAQENI